VTIREVYLILKKTIVKFYVKYKEELLAYRCKSVEEKGGQEP